MKVLTHITKSYKDYQPFREKTIILCTHATEATVRFASCLKLLGAKVCYYPIPFSHDHLSVAEMKKKGIEMIDNDAQLGEIIRSTNIIIEDGARISKRLYENIDHHTFRDDLFSIEQTTNGIRFFQAHHDQKLWYPVINAAESALKQQIENALATPESIIVSFLSASSQSLTQKNVMVIGYGSVGSGLAKLCRDHGSEVVIVESDALRRLFSKTQGFHTLGPEQIQQQLPNIDVIFSCTANHRGSLLNLEKVALMKDGAIICNAGSGTGELDSALLTEGKFHKNQGEVTVAITKDHIECSLTKMKDKKTIKILFQGHPINLRYGKGTSSEILDLVFSLILLAALKTHPASLEKNINPIDKSVESALALYTEEVRINKQERVPALLTEKKLMMSDRPYGGVMKFGLPGEHLDRFSLARAVFTPNTKTKGHYHLISEEAYFFESGSAVIHLWHYKTPNEKTTHHVTKGDYLTIPTGFVHLIETKDEECTSLVIASPPFSFWDQFFPEED